MNDQFSTRFIATLSIESDEVVQISETIYAEHFLGDIYQLHCIFKRGRNTFFEGF
jgi:hypothetical protein